MSPGLFSRELIMYSCTHVRSEVAASPLEPMGAFPKLAGLPYLLPTICKTHAGAVQLLNMAAAAVAQSFARADLYGPKRDAGGAAPRSPPSPSFSCERMFGCATRSPCRNALLWGAQ
jgi:hypothetical protein